MAELFGCGQSNISMLENGSRELTPEQVNILYANFDKDKIDKYIVVPNDMFVNTNEVSNPKISYTNGVPYFDVDFIAGFDLVPNDQTRTPNYLIDFEKYNHATCWCNVSGHSMEPEINNGDIIALKEVVDFSFLPSGEVYAIITKNDMRTIKRVKDNGDTYTLIPTNKSAEYGEQTIKKDMIGRVFQVLGCMKRL